jgi:DNA repair protein RadC
MSQLSLSLDSSLLVRDDQGRYLSATADQILEAARYVIDQKIPRGTLFTSPALVKDYLRTKLASFEHEIFAALFLDSQNRLIEYVEMFRGTIDQTSVYPREVVKTALHLNAAAVIFSHNQPHRSIQACRWRRSASATPSAAARRRGSRCAPSMTARRSISSSHRASRKANCRRYS